MICRQTKTVQSQTTYQKRLTEAIRALSQERKLSPEDKKRGVSVLKRALQRAQAQR